MLAAIILSTFSRDQIMFIVFELFDGNGNGFIEKHEFSGLTKAVDELAGSGFPGNYAESVKKVDVDGDGVIDFNEFMQINDSFPLIFFPALKIQDRMRKNTLGVSAWKQKVTKFNNAHKQALEKEEKAAKVAAGGSEDALKPGSVSVADAEVEAEATYL